MGETQQVRTPSWMTLDPDERVRLRATPSNNLLMGGAVGGLLLITLGAVPFIVTRSVDTGRRVTFALTGLVVVVILGAFLLTRRREYVITSKRVSVAVGLRSKSVRSIDVEDVIDISLEQSRIQRFLAIGTVRFVLDGADDLEFALVGNPHFVYERALDFL